MEMIVLQLVVITFQLYHVISFKLQLVKVWKWKCSDVPIRSKASHEREKDGRGTKREETVRKYLKWFNMAKWQRFCGWETLCEACTRREKQRSNPVSFNLLYHCHHTFTSHVFIHSTSQIAVMEGPSQQERKDLFPLLTGAGSSGCRLYLFWVGHLFLMLESQWRGRDVVSSDSFGWNS